MPLRDDGQVGLSRAAAFRNALPVRLIRTAAANAAVDKILAQASRLRMQSDDVLRRASLELKAKALEGTSLGALVVPAFALVKETARRVLGMEPYPCQMLAGLALHQGAIVEMATGEGKTLAAVAPAYLNALADRGVHIVTVNDYLAARDATEMGPVFESLGLSVGLVVHETDPTERRRAYRRHVTYTTNKDLGFDYLRDEDAARRPLDWGGGFDPTGGRLQRSIWHFAIVDEADSILIDDARTPLILASTPAIDEEAADICRRANETADELREGVDFRHDRKKRTVEWLPAGAVKVVRALGGRRSPSGKHVDWLTATLRAVKARRLFERDVDYVLDADEVVIVDENTGRRMPGRQWEDGLHQAVACKEGLPVLGKSKTLAKTTYQRYFNRYEKLAGMTGTAWPAARELATVFATPTRRIPTHRPCIRDVLPDQVFATEAAKWEAVVAAVVALHEIGRPVLVGTRSIDKSELLSARLTDAGVPHTVLNAHHEAEEAAIVAEAGRHGRVTVATNMAGRGTDIKLDREALAAGGLAVIGTERHESRRVDLQLMGRGARQGDPGTAQFFVSLEDQLVRRNRPRQCERLVARFGQSTTALPPWASRFVSRVQRSVERRHRKVRMDLLRSEWREAKQNRELGVE